MSVCRRHDILAFEAYLPGKENRPQVTGVTVSAHLPSQSNKW
jgi:hypothetical protein